uniref:condensation domain-containing protein n=1 Tax=Nocardiopsis halotolerans TaxID=124252 RepID=UPI0003619F1C
MKTTNTDDTIDLLRRIRSLPPKKQRALRAVLARRGVDLSALESIPPRPTAGDEPVQLSFAQQRLWFLAQLEGTNAHYNIPLALRLRGSLDRGALLRALETIVERHEVLRTRFVERDGVAYQVVGDGRSFEVGEEDLADPAELPSLCEKEAMTPFDLEHDFLIRARLLRRSPDEHVLLVTMHHSVSDGWSLGVFSGELTALYEAFRDGRPDPLEPLAIQYADYAHWQRRWLVDDVLGRQVDHWREQLQGSDPQVSLPTDRPRPAVRTYHGAREGFLVPSELTRSLRELGEEHGATLYMVLLSAYAVLLKRYGGQEDITIGSPVANRNRLEVEDLIGFFVNTLVMRADLTGDPVFHELLARVKETALRAYDHQDVPFEAVVDALQPDRDLSHAPLFQVAFVLQEERTERVVRLGDLEISPVDVDYRVTKFDLTLELREGPDGLAGSVEYNTDLYDRETVQRFVHHYTTLLSSIVADPGERVSRLPMLDDVERRRVLEEW